MTLLEMILAISIVSVIFAALLPQFRVILNSWATREGAAESLQNARVLIDHFNRNLSTATKVTAVSDSTTTSGYIEYEDADGDTYRYDVSGGNYVQFGEVGDVDELAGPVSQFQFTCADACDLATPITDGNSIRFVTLVTTLTNPAAMSADRTFTTQVYLRANYSDAGGEFSSGPPFEFESVVGKTPALARIDGTHYLCTYGMDGKKVDDGGWAVVLTVDTGDWSISKETPFEYDTAKGKTPALAQIDSTHYLCVYAGDGDDGWAVVLTVDTGDWSISKQTPFEFDNQKGEVPALAQIDSTHYLCAYEGDGNKAWSVVLTVDTGDWSVSKETPFEFDDDDIWSPALVQIDGTHYLCAYSDEDDDGWAVVLTVDTGDWDISKETPFEFDSSQGWAPALAQINSTHYLCAYCGSGDDGWAVVLTVDTGDWDISKETPFEFDDQIAWGIALAQIDSSNYLCPYTSLGDDGWATRLTVNTVSWEISQGSPYEFDSTKGKDPALAQIDDDDYLCAYAGDGDDGWALVLMPDTGGSMAP